MLKSSHPQLLAMQSCQYGSADADLRQALQQKNCMPTVSGKPPI
jgi:hypothetical protein